MRYESSCAAARSTGTKCCGTASSARSAGRPGRFVPESVELHEMAATGRSYRSQPIVNASSLTEMKRGKR